MPVIRRKLATSAPAAAAVPISNQRGMNVKSAAQYLGTSTWQIRKYFREGVLKPFPIGRAKIVDRHDLDALIERLKAA
jgi:Helix-turn-helix domain